LATFTGYRVALCLGEWQRADRFRFALQRHLRRFRWQRHAEFILELSAGATPKPHQWADAGPDPRYDYRLVRHLFYLHAGYCDDHQFQRLPHWLRPGDCIHQRDPQRLQICTGNESFTQSNTYAYGYSYGNGYIYTYCNSNRNAHADTGESYPNSYTVAQSERVADGVTDTLSNAFSDAESVTVADTFAKSHTVSDTEPFPHTQPEPFTHAITHTDTISDACCAEGIKWQQRNCQ
jgi:hypothetical protein